MLTVRTERQIVFGVRTSRWARTGGVFLLHQRRRIATRTLTRGRRGRCSAINLPLRSRCGIQRLPSQRCGRVPRRAVSLLHCARCPLPYDQRYHFQQQQQKQQNYRNVLATTERLKDKRSVIRTAV